MKYVRPKLHETSNTAKVVEEQGTVTLTVPSLFGEGGREFTADRMTVNNLNGRKQSTVHISSGDNVVGISLPQAGSPRVVVEWYSNGVRMVRVDGAPSTLAESMVALVGVITSRVEGEVDTAGRLTAELCGCLDELIEIAAERL